jgi:uncharacterized protein
MAVTREGEVVCPQCVVADTPLRRMKGLLGRSRLEEDEGMLIQPASSIHTWFMRFPIDVVFLDRELRVRRVVEAVRPWRFAFGWRARAVLELPAGAAARSGLVAGQKLVLK